jgi:hypothetical protein
MHKTPVCTFLTFCSRNSLDSISLINACSPCFVRTDVGLEYFVKSGTWYETLRLTMEKVNSSAPKATPFAVITPYTTDDCTFFGNCFGPFLGKLVPETNSSVQT